ncbi:MAG: glutathione S-transferase family protein [Alphaproteobacteria bacterium]
MSRKSLKLVSHHLCPYVQRAVIALTEKNVPFERVDVDLGHKPDWFKAISPLGKVPLLRVDDTTIFESAVIVEFLEETQPQPLHPRDPLRRAQHRSWIEFSSAALNDIATFYRAPSAEILDESRLRLMAKFTQMEAHLRDGPWFDGDTFSLVDAALGPVFRYFDTFDVIGEFGFFDNLPRTQSLRAALTGRPSVRTAVAKDYHDRLMTFLRDRNSYLSTMMSSAE